MKNLDVILHKLGSQNKYSVGSYIIVPDTEWNIPYCYNAAMVQGRDYKGPIAVPKEFL